MNSSVPSNRRWFLFLVLFFFLLWEILARYIGREIILPTLGRTLQQLWVIITAEYFLKALGATAGRIGITFFIDLSAALILGCFAGLSPRFEQILKPIEIVTRAVPTMGRADASKLT